MIKKSSIIKLFICCINLADQVYGDQEMHGVVRRHCMDYMVR